jgi:CubicO group peptidase (beta-lactamase class C family)
VLRGADFPRAVGRPGGSADRVLGAFGQRVYVNPAEQVVVVIQSAWRRPSDPEAEAETVALIRAMVRALRS